MSTFETAKIVFALIGIDVLTLVPPFHPQPKSDEMELRYRETAKEITGVANSTVSFALWVFFLALWAGSVSVYWIFTPSSEVNLFIATLCVYFASVLMNHWIPFIFWSWGAWWPAMWARIAEVLFAAATIVLYGITAGTDHLLIWISFGLGVAYWAWLLYNLYLNIQFARFDYGAVMGESEMMYATNERRPSGQKKRSLLPIYSGVTL